MKKAAILFISATALVSAAFAGEGATPKDILIWTTFSSL